MKIITTKAELLGPLSRVASIVASKQTMPILANVLLQVSGGRLTLTCSDLESELISSIPCDAGDGSITVPAKKLADVIKVMADAPISLSVEADRVIVKCGRSRHSLVTLPASEFPATTEHEYTQTFSVPAAELAAMMKRTEFAMAFQDVRFYLCGLLVEFRSDGIRCVATDGHRLAYAGASGDVLHSVLIPRNAVAQIARMLDSGDAQISVSRNHIRVTCGQHIVTSKLIDGRYPDYMMMASRPPTIAVCDRAELIDGLRRVAVLANEKYRGVKIEAGAGSIKISGANERQDESTEVIDADTPSEITAAWKVDYLTEALGALESDRVEFCASLTSGVPAAYLSDASSVHVICCLRL